jgi:XTP/dITP diphosphohydrolase
MEQIILATGNKGKLREFADMLADFPVKLSALSDHFNPVPDIPETGSTFEENSRIKALWVFNKTGGWVLADDSGIEVDCLAGAPGVFSARYAGQGAGDAANLNKLLAAMEGIQEEKRTARFKCVITLVTGPDIVQVARGVCEGRIAFAPRGEGGFGYDPAFVPNGFHSTFGELDPRIKHAISHRGKALLNLRKEFVHIYDRSRG